MPPTTVFPISVPSNPAARIAKITLGTVASLSFPRVTRAIIEGRLPNKLTGLHRLIIVAVVEQYARQGRLNELSHLHRWLWEGAEAVAFHQMAEGRFNLLWRDSHAIIIEELRFYLEEHNLLNRFSTFCEIGTGSGLVLNHITEQLPIGRFIGLDLSVEQTERNTTRFAGIKHFSFATGDLRAWIPKHAEPGWIYFSNGGVLEYLSLSELDEHFSTLASSLAPAMVVLVEPISATHDITNDPRSLPHGTERTFSHNYPTALRRAGFEVLSCKEVTVEGWRFSRVMAITPGCSPSTPSPT